MANKYYRKNFKEGTGPAAGLGPTARKITKELAKGITGAVSKKELKFIESLKAAAKPKKKFKSPMERQRKLDTLKSEAAKTGGKVMSADEMTKLKGESDKSYESRMKKVFEAKKGGRAALRMGTKKNFNKEEREVQKKVDRDALVFGAKKAIERAKNKENKSATAMTTKIRKVLDARTNKPVFATNSQIMNNPDRFKPITSMIKMLKQDDKAKADKRIMDYMKSKEPGGRFSEKDIERSKKALGMKKGGRAKMMGGGMMGRRFGMKEGSLKPVDPKTQKGLSKLPTEVRNKMGYMKKGGRA